MTFAVRLLTALALAWLVVSDSWLISVQADFNYKDALSKSILFLEAQRSGRLPPDNRIPWRGHSGLQDGNDSSVDLVGGYYDAGDNVKYGLPMAFTVTTLAWGALAYGAQLQQAGELENVRSAIRWGTDYFLKACSRRDLVWVQVGDPVADHQCWTRPENMNTPRTLYNIDHNTPGTEIAAETAAAFAASSIVFRKADHPYSRRLLNKAKLLFKFAVEHKGSYDGECPFYCSFSGYNDELLWAASWLYMATKREVYLKYIQDQGITASVDEFSWDLKYAGVQVLLSSLYFAGEKSLGTYKSQADNFVCSVLPDSPYSKISLSPGGLIHIRDGANTQYVTSTAYLLSVYSDILTKYGQSVDCGGRTFQASDLMAFAKGQIDYLLGNNPKGMSYMVGFGEKSPQQAHHRGASVPQMSPDSLVTCALSFTMWFKREGPNFHELTGAIVGGPDRYDNFEDLRWDSTKLEPTTYVNSLAVGVLAKLAAP
ncbi:Endoglucanase 16 [Nymphaea thermarum]|nr:Endoglucanase 16 [Nymphaea thermarum]